MMQSPSSPTASAFDLETAQAHENRTLAEFETMLADPSGGAVRDTSTAFAGGSRLWRVMPIVLLAGAGAALALVQTGLRDNPTTGRSVALAPPSR